MRLLCAVLVALLVLLVGCQGIEVNEVRELNDTWWEMYNQDRRPTEEEIEEYNGLTPEEQMDWFEQGKPTPGPLPEESVDSVRDYYESQNIKLDLAEHGDDTEDDNTQEDPD